MKIYVIEEVMFHEYSMPIEAWADKDKAEARAEELEKKAGDKIDAFEITEIELKDN
jgi:hypothetical protein